MNFWTTPRCGVMRLFPCTVEETVRTAIARISSISVSENVVFWCTFVPKCPRRQQIPVLLAWLHICSLWAARQFFIWAPFFWSDAAASICAGNQHLRWTELCNKLTNTNASLATLVTESIWWEFDKFSLEYHRKHINIQAIHTHTHSVHALLTVRLMQKTRDREITRNGWQKQSTLGRSRLYEIFLKRIQHYITRLPVLNASFIFNVCVPVTSWDASTSDFLSFIAVFRILPSNIPGIFPDQCDACS